MLRAAERCVVAQRVEEAGPKRAGVPDHDPHPARPPETGEGKRNARPAQPFERERLDEVEPRLPGHVREPIENHVFSPQPEGIGPRKKVIETPKKEGPVVDFTVPPFALKMNNKVRSCHGSGSRQV